MKYLKKSLGLVLAAILLINSVGISANATSWIKWPYGTYKGTGSNKSLKLDWGFISNPDYFLTHNEKYDQEVQVYYLSSGEKYSYYDEATSMMFKKTKTTNKYKSKQYGMKGARKVSRYFTITVKSKSLVFKEYYDGKKVDTIKFKLQKRLSKNVS